LFLNTNLEDKDGVILKGLVYFKGCLQISDIEELQLKIAECEHDSKIAGDFEQKKTLELISRDFYWPKIKKWINEYVHTYNVCQCMKLPKYAKFGILQSLELSYSLWESTLVDFIVALAESEGHTHIMVVVNHFLKMAHFIALAETATAQDATQVFLKEV
jgi:hypothetical protein